MATRKGDPCPRLALGGGVVVPEDAAPRAHVWTGALGSPQRCAGDAAPGRPRQVWVGRRDGELRLPCPVTAALWEADFLGSSFALTPSEGGDVTPFLSVFFSHSASACSGRGQGGWDKAARGPDGAADGPAVPPPPAAAPAGR